MTTSNHIKILSALTATAITGLTFNVAAEAKPVFTEMVKAAMK